MHSLRVNLRTKRRCISAARTIASRCPSVLWRAWTHAAELCRDSICSKTLLRKMALQLDAAPPRLLSCDALSSFLREIGDLDSAFTRLPSLWADQLHTIDISSSWDSASLLLNCESLASFLREIEDLFDPFAPVKRLNAPSPSRCPSISQYAGVYDGAATQTSKTDQVKSVHKEISALYRILAMSSQSSCVPLQQPCLLEAACRP